jgi:hypothetical protein
VLEPRLFLVNNERPNSLNYVSRPWRSAKRWACQERAACSNAAHSTRWIKDLPNHNKSTRFSIQNTFFSNQSSARNHRINNYKFLNVAKNFKYPLQYCKRCVMAQKSRWSQNFTSVPKVSSLSGRYWRQGWPKT